VRRLLVRYRDYAKKVPFIYFFATPETGSQLARLGTALSSNPLLESLIPGSQNEYLQVLENDWKAAHFATRQYCAYENRKFDGMIIVDRLSGTRDCDDTVAIDEDHQSIVKPTSPAHASYIAFQNAIRANPINPKLPTASAALLPPAAKTAGSHVTQGLPANEKVEGIREEGLMLSKEIKDFLAERRAHDPDVGPEPGFEAAGAGMELDNRTPPYMKETRELFGKKFEARIADLHDEFSRRGLQDQTLDNLYENIATIIGNVDAAISKIAESIRKLAALSPPEGMFKDESDTSLADIAIEEANKVDAMTEATMQRLEAQEIPDAVRFSFFSDFKQCCLNQVEYLRAEMLRRLGPSAYDSHEMRSFNGFNGLTEMEKNPTGSIATVLDYAPHFRRLAIRLKRKAHPLSGPKALTYSEMQVAAERADIPHKIVVTIETTTDITSGYVFVQFAGRYTLMSSDFADAKPLAGGRDVIDNPELAKLLELVWNPTMSVYAVKIGKTPLTSDRPIHVVVESHEEVHVAKVLFFEE
jgi:hypothetical protein